MVLETKGDVIKDLVLEGPLGKWLGARKPAHPPAGGLAAPFATPPRSFHSLLMKTSFYLATVASLYS